MKALDLFCGAGGASAGLARLGYDVTGVDIKPQPRYPFNFIQGDATALSTDFVSSFDFIWASPPCQAFTAAKSLHGLKHPNLIPITRKLLIESGRPWVIENVPKAPLNNPTVVCGLALGLNVKRHRHFETNFNCIGTTCPKGHPGDWLIVFGFTALRRSRGQGTGPRKDRGKTKGKSVPHAEACAAMGIDWMKPMELSQAIPPAYSEFIVRQLDSNKGVK